MKEFNKYTKALKEYQEYSRSYNEQVQKLKGQIKDLESKKSKIELEITEKLTRVSIGGKPASPVETTVLQRERVLERLLNEVKLKGI